MKKRLATYSAFADDEEGVTTGPLSDDVVTLIVVTLKMARQNENDKKENVNKYECVCFRNGEKKRGETLAI